MLFYRVKNAASLSLALISRVSLCMFIVSQTMLLHTVSALLVLLAPLAVCEGDCVTVESEAPGNWQGLLQLGPFESDVSDWEISIREGFRNSCSVN